MAKEGKSQCPNCGGWYVNLGTHMRFCKTEKSREEKPVDKLEIINGLTKCCHSKVKTIYTGPDAQHRKIYKVCKKCGKRQRIK